MKLRSKLIPVIASLGATAVVAPCLTSCGGLNMETHNMLGEYYNHVIPRLPTTIYGEKEVTDTYLNDAKWFPSILKDDILYTFANNVKEANASGDFPYTFTKYYLYVQNFDIDEQTHKAKFSIIMDVAGTLKNGGSPITYFEKGDLTKPHTVNGFNLTYTISFGDNENKAFDFAFNRSVTAANQDKQFSITLPCLGKEVPEEDIRATSIAFGYILEGTETDHEIIPVDANENIDFTTEASLNSSAIFYDQFFYDVAFPTNNIMTLISHYFYFVNCVLA